MPVYFKTIEWISIEYKELQNQQMYLNQSNIFPGFGFRITELN